MIPVYSFMQFMSRYSKMNKSILFLAGLWYIIKVVVLLPGLCPGALVYSKGMVL